MEILKRINKYKFWCTIFTCILVLSIITAFLFINQNYEISIIFFSIFMLCIIFYIPFSLYAFYLNRWIVFKKNAKKSNILKSNVYDELESAVKFDKNTFATKNFLI